MFAVEPFNALHRSKDAAYKIYTWVPISTDSLLTLFRKDLIPDAEAAAALQGTSFDEEAHKVRTHTRGMRFSCQLNTLQLMWAPTGRLLQSPCLPDMYDHEIGPQGVRTALSPAHPQICLLNTASCGID